MGDVIRFPSALTSRSERVDTLCAAVAEGAVEYPIDAYEADGAVRLDLGDLELWLTADEATELAGKLARAAAVAMKQGGR